MERPLNFLLVLWLLLGTLSVAAQERTPEEEAAYTKVIIQRADKIVAKIGIADSTKAIRVRDVIAQQYRNLSEIHDGRDAKVKSVRKEFEADSKKRDEQIALIEAETTASLDKLHKAYLSKLSAELSDEQIEKVKDGMTYGVLPLTYNGYLDMLPSLTEEQKKQIMEWLIEAREHAMDAGSSEKKHWWFGKYKGRINNYLSAQGYDLKKAGEEWEKRRKSKQENKTG